MLPNSRTNTSKHSLRIKSAAELLRRKKARRGLLDFTQYTFKDYMVAPHLEQLAAKLEAVERGECKRLIVVMPPRYGKSELVSIRFPCWYLGKHPTDYIVKTSYSEAITLVHSRQARDVFITPEMKLLFPNIHYRPERKGQEAVVPERQAASEWGTKQGGSYYAVGIGGGLTGRGFSLGIVDDALKDAEEAQSQLIRDKVWEWYRTVFRTRANPGAAIIVVMTRWHHSDLVGRLLDLAKEDPTADQWEVLHFKALTDNQPLWPERYSFDDLMATKSSIGSRNFEALYQGEPSIAEGNIIKRNWWKEYENVPANMNKVHSWDTAFSAKGEANYSVCTVWGISDNGYYLLDVWRGRVDFPELKSIAIQLYNRDRPQAVLIEEKATGGPLVQELQSAYPIPVLPVQPHKDKITRAYAITPMIEAGKVLIPKSAPWLFDYLEEMSAFPTGQYDDQVDSTTQFLNWINLREEERVVIYDVERDFRGLLADI